MTTLGKRPCEPVRATDNDDDDNDGNIDDHSATLSRKRQCRGPPGGPAEIVAGDEWDGAKCDEEDIAARDRIVAAVLTDDSSIEDIAAALIKPSTYQVELALIQLFCQGRAFSRLCRAIDDPSASVHWDIAVGALLYRAARDDCPNAVGALIIRMAADGDVKDALATAVEKDDVAAVKTIVRACENDTNTSIELFRLVTCNALREAAKLGKVAIVDYLAGLCDGETVEELLAECAARNDDPKAAVFAALWQHADLCAHAYVKSLPPCPALDYLWAFVESGEPCADGCMSNVADDSEDDNDDSEDEDSQDCAGDDDGDDDDDDDQTKTDRP